MFHYINSNYNNNYLSLRNFAVIIENKHNNEIVDTKQLNILTINTRPSVE
jgi:hypothetical protein